MPPQVNEPLLSAPPPLDVAAKAKTDDPKKKQRILVDKPALSEAPVPWHSQVLLIGALSFFVYIFPSMESLDEVATVETFTKVLFPAYMSVEFVTGMRLLFASIIFFDCLYAVLWAEWDKETDYAADSKLITITIPTRGYFKQPKPSVLKALLTMTSFTMVSFFVLGVAFALSGTISLLHILNMDVSPWLLRVALLLFECTAPTTLLVGAVVKYVLWPLALEQGSGNTAVLSHPILLLEHNGNVIMAITEVALLGGLPVRISHIAIAPIFGICYVGFTWWMADKWAGKEKGPQFLYPFFDTTLGWQSTFSLLVLLAVLSFFYCLFSYADYGISMLAGGIWTHILAIGVMVLLVCRWRD